MKHGEIAERLVETLYHVSYHKHRIPNWPILPIAAGIGNLWKGIIPTNADLRLLATPVITACDITEEIDDKDYNINNIYVARYTIPPVKLQRPYIRYTEPGSVLVRIEWYDLTNTPRRNSGDLIIGKHRGEYKFLGSTKSVERASIAAQHFIKTHTVMPGIRVLLESSWVARLRLEKKSPAIDLPTNAEGMYALFSDRAKTGNRRKALLHWVKEHSRVVRGRSYNVVEHLRGVHQFDWKGATVQVTPPADSIERATMKTKVPPSVLQAVKRYRSTVEELDNPNIADAMGAQ